MKESSAGNILKSNLSNKTILLTGATGFLGSNLLRRFVEENFAKIIILKRSFSNTSRIVDIINIKDIISYNCDQINLEDVFKDNSIDAIIHCATEYGRTSDSSYKVLETNLMFPIKLLDLAVKYSVDVFINTDSYFNKEDFSYSYLRDYSLSKKSLLLWLNNYSQKIKIINLRLEHMFGFNDSDNKFCKYIFNKIVINKEKTIDLTYGEQKRDFIYIDDVVEAYKKSLEYGLTHDFRIRNFDIGTGLAVAIKDFVIYMAEKSGNIKNCSLNFGKIPYRNDEIMCSKANILELKDINFKPVYSYKDGIDLMIEQYERTTHGLK